MKSPVAISERIVSPLAISEMERRWSLVRKNMESQQIGALVALGSEDFLGGYVRWLCNRPALNGYHSVVIFHANALMSLIEHGPLDGRRTVSGNPEFPGVEELYTTAAWRSVNYTHLYEADLACKILRHRGYRRIGVVGAGAMPHGFVKQMASIGIELFDFTDTIDRLKALKSEAETTEITKAAEIQDAIFSSLLAQIKPGMRDLDVMAIVQYESRKRGSEQGVFHVSSQKIGTPTFLAPPHLQGRTFQHGDHLSVLIENNSPSGFYTELGRTIVLGKSSPELFDAMTLAVDAQHEVVKLLVPGARSRDIAEAHDAFLGSHGLPPEGRLFAHGQGYDLVERPLIRSDETFELSEGMNIVVHPGFVQSGAFGFVCDNFIVRSDGAQPIHKTAQKVFEV